MRSSPYIVLSDRDFSKHYFAGAERACVAQPIQYLSFRESYVSEHTASPYTERFTFTGKERDEEIGFTYHGARYYDASLMCSWFSVDPLSDKYPSVTPYNYCAWTRPTGGHEHLLIKYYFVNNPMKLVDLDGEFPVPIHKKMVEAALNNKNISFDIRKGLLYGTDVYSDWIHSSDSSFQMDNMKGTESIIIQYNDHRE